MDLESREELLERLFDVGVASDDVTVADVTSRADPARFNAVASRLAADVAALAPAAGADDQRGVTAAAAAVYRAVAGAGANPAASSSRAEQALRRLAAAIDATDTYRLTPRKTIHTTRHTPKGTGTSFSSRHCWMYNDRGVAGLYLTAARGERGGGVEGATNFRGL